MQCTSRITLWTFQGGKMIQTFNLNDITYTFRCFNSDCAINVPFHVNFLRVRDPANFSVTISSPESQYALECSSSVDVCSHFNDPVNHRPLKNFYALKSLWHLAGKPEKYHFTERKDVRSQRIRQSDKSGNEMSTSIKLGMIMQKSVLDCC